MINNKAGNNILQELVARPPGLIHTDTRVSGVPRPGCQAYQHPGVSMLEIRVSYNLFI